MAGCTTGGPCHPDFCLQSEEVRHDDLEQFGMLLISNVQWESPYKSRVHKPRVASTLLLYGDSH